MFVCGVMKKTTFTVKNHKNKGQTPIVSISGNVTPPIVCIAGAERGNWAPSRNVSKLTPIHLFLAP